VHKGRAVCSAVGETVFGRVAGAAEPIGHLHPACAFPTVSGVPDRATSEIDKTPEPIREPWMPRTRARAMAPRGRAKFFF